ncbi:hypothetical protein ES288_D05G114400v1, partial [Gossypium darwinii]
GYQFDFVYDWTILKYPQLTGSSRQRLCSGKAALNFRASAERTNKLSETIDIEINLAYLSFLSHKLSFTFFF